MLFLPVLLLSTTKQQRNFPYTGLTVAIVKNIVIKLFIFTLISLSSACMAINQEPNRR